MTADILSRGLTPLVKWIAPALFLALGAGCGSCGSEDPLEVDEPEILSFLVEPATIVVGEEATLSWETRYAISIEILGQDGETLDLGDIDVTEGSVTVSPDATTTYVLTAAGEEGTTAATREVTLTVVDPGAPVIESFTASPSEIAGGGEAILSWTTSGAISIEILHGPGGTVDLGDASASQGTVSVSPAATTEYTLRATGLGGVTEAATTVTVTTGPVVLSFEADLEIVVPGTDVSLSWSVENVSSVALFANENEIFASSDAADSGSHTARVDLLTEFTLVATGELEASASKVLTVQVIPDVVSFTIDGYEGQVVVRPDDSVTFAWTTLGADRIEITAPSGDLVHAVEGDSALDGSFESMNLTAGTYTLTAASGLLDDSKTVEVSLSLDPRIVSFSVSDSAVTAGQTVVFSWVVEDAEELRLHVTDIGDVDLSGYDLGMHHINVTLHTPGSVTATFTAVNTHGETTAEETVDVVLPPSIEDFTVLPRRVNAGDSVTVSWVTSQAVAIRVEKDGQDLLVDETITTGSITDTVDTESTYKLRAFNSVGFEVASESVAVDLGAPQLLSFDASSMHVAPGTTFTLSWECVGGDEIVISLGEEVLWSSEDPATVASGSGDFTAPADVGEYEYQVRVMNGAGADEDSLRILVSDGPIIVDFAVSAESITLGETFRVSWTVTNDAGGAVPSLTLTDDQDLDYPLAGHDPNQDWADIEPIEIGKRTFTFTASTGDESSDAATEFIVDVVAAPIIHYFVAEPDFIDTAEGDDPETTLRWSVGNAVALTVSELDQNRDPIDPPLEDRALDPSQVETGQMTREVTATTRYRLSASNAAGRLVTADLRVLVDGAKIVYFTGRMFELGTEGEDLVEIVEGESVLLEWATERAEHVTLMPMDSMYPVDDLFVDISENVDAVEVFFSEADEGHVNIEFPEEFRFPFFGEEHDEVRVLTKGYLSFNLTEEAWWQTHRLPAPSSVNPIIAPFWDDLHVKDTGRAFWQFFEEPGGVDYLVVQWSNMQSYFSPSRVADLNFQVVLFADGTLDFRYGDMLSSNATFAEGGWASIGFSDATGSQGYSLSYQTRLPLEWRSWRAIFDLPVEGSHLVSPTTNTAFDLVAHNENGTDEASVEVIVHPAVRSLAASSSPAEIEVERDFSINWTVTNAHEIRLYDEDGALLHEQHVSGSGSQSGSFGVLAPEQPGSYSYSVVAVGAFERDQVTLPLSVLVRPRFEIVSFGVDNEFISMGDPVLVSWVTSGAASGTLKRGIDSIPITEGVVEGNLDQGSFFFGAVYSSCDITITVSDGTGRSRTETVTVYVDAAQIHDFSVSSNMIAAGESVELSWSTSNADAVSIARAGEDVAVDIYEAPDFSLVDISGRPDAVYHSLGYGAHLDVFEHMGGFAAGFAFPYYGSSRKSVRIHSYGSISFQHSAGLSWTNSQFPGGSGVRSPQMSIFWGDLTQRTDGGVYYVFGQDAEGEYMRVQWNNFRHWDETSSSLTFQIVLRSSGTFEFIYGPMTGSANMIAGGLTSIGFDNDAGDEGYQLTYRQPVAGGLTGRAWRFQPGDIVDESGTMVVELDETRTFELCATGSGYTECREVTVVVVQPGVVMVSEVMPKPTPSVGEGGQWFELYNTTLADLDLRGLVIAIDDTEHVIEHEEPVVVPAKGYIVLGRSAVLGGYGPDYVYGEDIVMEPAGSKIEVFFGDLVIDSFTYDDESFSVQAGKSLSLHPSKLTGNPDDNLDAAFWCEPTTEFGDEGQYGTPGGPNLGLECAQSSGLFPFTRSQYVAIPDNTPSGVIDQVDVDVFCGVQQVTVFVDITHTFINDLIVRLTSPNGTAVTLQNRTGGGAEDIVGTYADSGGDFIPAEPLSAFAGAESYGLWTLFISDNAGWDTGHLNGWTLNIDCG